MIPTKPHLSAAALIPSMDAYRERYAHSIADPASYWRAEAEGLTWFHPDATLEVEAHDEDVDINWFAGGRLNACYNAVDRHAQARPDDTALIWVANEPGQYQHISWRQLKRQVSRVANVLKSQGVRRGDRVCIYLPMIPALAYTVLACARIGAIHSVVFAGFSAEALRDRILDAGARVLITANQGLRGSKHIPLKQIADAAVDGVSLVDRVLVVRHTEADVPMKAGRDLWLHEEMARHRATCPVEWMASEDPLFILYTSGSTGKPKGVLHTTAGYLLYTSTTHRYVFDVQPGSVYFCAADVGWITGHSYILYGPLTNGVTSVMFESVPTFPDAGRYWQVVDDLKVDVFYTAPTALRAIMAAGDGFVNRYDRGSLRVLGTVGEPINPEVWRWYHDVVGGGRCAVVDTWWQTETGGMLIAPLPGATPVKPGSATLPLFGVEPVLLDDDGQVVEGNDVRGNLCIKGTWPGQARTIWGDHQRFRETYYARFPGYYFTGDGCHRDADGYYWITGRVDDVLNVSGHRLGTAEIESALVAHEAVAEAAVVGFPHPIKGQGILAWVQLGEGYADWDAEELVGALKQQVRQAIGAIASPDRVLIVPGLPKTRSGKIMRRILRKLAAGEHGDLGDTSTLADPAVVEALIAAAGLE